MDRIAITAEPKPRRLSTFDGLSFATGAGLVAFIIGFGLAITEPKHVEKIVRVEVTPHEREYCDSRSCIYATPDGLRIVNYTNADLSCEPMESTVEAGVAANNSWWAIGRPGPFMKCHPIPQ